MYVYIHACVRECVGGKEEGASERASVGGRERARERAFTLARLRAGWGSR